MKEWPMNKDTKPIVSIVLGSYNRRAFLQGALESVRRNGMDFPYEIIVVDGGSTDGSLAYLESQKDVIMIVQHNRGIFRGKPVERRPWGYFMNLGFKCARGKYICMISDDCLLVPGAVQSGVDLFEKLLSEGRNIGAMAFYWRNWPEDRDYLVGTTLGGKIFVNHGLYLRKAVQEVGWIDEENYSFYHADGDLSLKLWHRGYEVVDAPDSFVEHFLHSNVVARKNNMEKQQKDWQAYLRQWKDIFCNSGQKDAGGAIHKSYRDSQKICMMFPFFPRLGIRVRMVAKRIFSAVNRSR